MRSRLGWLLAAVLAGCDAPADACGDGVADIGALCFPADEAVRVGYGFAPAAMVAADLDGDGALDVAAASPSRQTVTIAWGPARETATSWALGEEIAGLAVGDVDGDGRLDLAVALPGSDAVAALHGRGGRVFERGEKIAVGSAPRAVLVVDLDGDGRGEVVTADVGDRGVSVVRDREVATVIVGAGPHALAAGQLDGADGVDVAVALADSAEVQVLLGDGRGGLLPGERFRVGAGPLAMVAADFDGDGVDEVATADALDDTVTVIAADVRTWAVPARPTGLVVVRDGELPALGVLSEGTGEVTRLDPRTGARAATLVGATALAAGDVDGAGEALVAGSTGATAVVRRGAGDGLVLTRAWAVEAWLGTMTPVDHDGDGREALLIDSATLNGLLLVDGADGTVIGAPIEVPLFEQARVLVPADVDADGRVDVVVAGAVGGVAAVQSLVQREGGFEPVGSPLPLAGSKVQAAVGGDVAGEGGTGVAVVVNDREETLWLLRGDGAGGWETVRTRSVEDRVAVIVPADLDGDAALDLVLLQESPGSGAWLSWLVNPAQGGEDGEVLFESPFAVVDVAVARLGDGNVSVVVCGPDGVSRMRGLAPVADPEEVTADSCRAVAARDGDGDGDIDVLVRGARAALSFITLLRNDGAGELSIASRQAVPNGVDGFAFAELDGVPAVDVVTTDSLLSTALYGSFAAVLLADEAEELGREVVGGFADVNGDAVADRVQVGPGLAVALATGDGGFAAWQHASLVGLSDPDVREVVDHAAGDVDGDGADEVVVLAEIDNALPLRAVTVVRVDADGRSHGETVARLASEADQVLVADLDGDGAAEILVGGYGGYGVASLTSLRAADDYAGRDQRVEVMPGRSFELSLHDVRGDGKLDLVINQWDLLVARGQGDGGFGQASEWGGITGLTGFLMHDLDGDRATDLLALQGGEGTNRSELLLVRGGSDGRAAGAPRRLLREVDALAIGDLDGDGMLELITGTMGAGDWPATLRIGAPAGGGAYVFHAQALPESGASMHLQELAVHDWDGDGRPDIAAVDGTGFTIVRQRP